LIELDDQDDVDQYLIAYDAVCEYSNKHHSTFNQYKLPYEVVLEGDDEIETEIETEDGTLYSLTGFRFYGANIGANFWVVFFKGAYLPQKLTLKSSIETEYKLFQKHVPSY
jgi:hypothetical protein